MTFTTPPDGDLTPLVAVPLAGAMLPRVQSLQAELTGLIHDAGFLRAWAPHTGSRPEATVPADRPGRACPARGSRAAYQYLAAVTAACRGVPS